MLRKQPIIKFKRDKLKSHSAFLSEYFHTPTHPLDKIIIKIPVFARMVF